MSRKRAPPKRHSQGQSQGHWRMALEILQLVVVVFSCAALYNWFTLPAALDMAQTRQVTATPTLVSIKRDFHLRLPLPGRPIDVTCSSAKRLCDALHQGRLPPMAFWLFDAGLLGGTWIVQARQGDRVWLSFEEQQGQFAAMRERSAVMAALSALTLLVIGLRKGWSRFRR